MLRRAEKHNIRKHTTVCKCFFYYSVRTDTHTHTHTAHCVPVHQDDARGEEGRPDGEEVRQGHVVGEALSHTLKPLGCRDVGRGDPLTAPPVQGGVGIVAVVHHRVGEVTLSQRDTTVET